MPLRKKIALKKAVRAGYGAGTHSSVELRCLKEYFAGHGRLPPGTRRLSADELVEIGGQDALMHYGEKGKEPMHLGPSSKYFRKGRLMTIEELKNAGLYGQYLEEHPPVEVYKDYPKKKREKGKGKKR